MASAISTLRRSRTPARPRELTQAISRAVYETTREGRSSYDGLCFPSRHGHDLVLWAVFERASDGARSGRLADVSIHALSPDMPEAQAAAALHGLRLL